MTNAAYKRWLLKEGKDKAGIQALLLKELNKRNQLAWMLMKESKAAFTIGGTETATKFLLKQINGHGKKTESTTD